MKKMFSNRRMCGIAAGLLLAAVLVLAGCPEPTGSEAASAGRGVLGQISGVVFDKITAQPLEGVTVEIYGSSQRTTTDKGGAYLLKDVIPGADYSLSFSKDGYRFTVRTGVDVDATAYKTDDPFGEWEALQDQLQALQDWATNSNVPVAPGDSWTYTEGGVWIDGSGTAVTIQNDHGEFKVVEIKMDYTYRKGIGIDLTGLTPLSGAIKGQIKLFKVTDGDKLNVAMADAVPIEKGIQVWLKEAALDIDGDGNDDADVLYGPVSTGDNGSFEFTGLPVETALTLVTNGFSTADGYSYTANATAYVWDGTAAEFAQANALTALNTSKANQHTNVGDIYFFTAGNYALISESSTGSIAQPISRSGSIALSFSKPINPGTFSATLNYGNATIADGGVSLSAAWSADAKQVTLTANIPSTGIIPGFPYSDDGTLAVGALQISGKATDGSSIFADNTNSATVGIPVYTAEGVKLIGVDVAPASVPSSRAAALTSQAVKLTFSKPLNTTTSKFNWNNNGLADFTFADGDATVYVWTDLLPDGGADLVCDFTAKADPFDTGTKTIGNGNEFTKAPTQQKLILESTNIYDARLDLTQKVTGEANFPVNGDIELKFSRVIPSTAVIRATLSTTQPNTISAATISPIAIAISGTGTNTLKINPASNLYGDHAYYLAVDITNGTEVIFSSVDARAGTGYALNGYNEIIADISGTAACRSIAFTTARIPLGPNAWASGDIGAGDTSKYSFDVTAGKQYRVWWNDTGDGDTTKTGDVSVAASYLGGTNIFTGQASGYTTAQTFTPAQSGAVILTVTGTAAGSFAIAYNDTGTRP
jgi:hypothetical protein